MRDAARAYRESAVRGASPVGLIVILYEESIRSVRKAQRALQNGNIEERTHALNHAIAVVGHLQGVLDFEKGGLVARDLFVFYSQMRSRLLEANAKADDQIMESIAVEFSKIKEAWQAVEHQISAAESEGDQLAPMLASSSMRLPAEPSWNTRAARR